MKYRFKIEEKVFIQFILILVQDLKRRGCLALEDRVINYIMSNFILRMKTFKFIQIHHLFINNPFFFKKQLLQAINQIFFNCQLLFKIKRVHHKNSRDQKIRIKIPKVLKIFQINQNRIQNMRMVIVIEIKIIKKQIYNQDTIYTPNKT